LVESRKGILGRDEARASSKDHGGEPSAASRVEMNGSTKSVEPPLTPLPAREARGVKKTLDNADDVIHGLGAYGLRRGIPPQTERMIKDRVYHATHKASPQHFKYVDGRDVCRYYVGWSGEYLKYGDHLREPRRDWRLFSTNRILVRQIPSKPPYCICASLTDEIFLNDRNSMNVINLREKPEYVLGMLNSRLVSWWFVHKFGKMQRETFPQFKANELADFPLPKNGEKHRDEIAKLATKIRICLARRSS